MIIGSKVKLISFNGNLFAPNECDPSENYWVLIGKSGTVIKSENYRSRVLVQFDELVSGFGLHCHNEIPNSLLILVSDLKNI